MVFLYFENSQLKTNSAEENEMKKKHNKAT